MSQIEFKDVSKVYPNGHVGLKDINLNIEKEQSSLDYQAQVNLHYVLSIAYMMSHQGILKENQLHKQKENHYC